MPGLRQAWESALSSAIFARPRKDAHLMDAKQVEAVRSNSQEGAEGKEEMQVRSVRRANVFRDFLGQSPGTVPEFRKPIVVNPAT